MIAGHFVTALVAHQKYPKGTLLFFLVASQFQDLLWLIFHYLGLEPTGPADVFDATVSKLMVDMVYSHDLIPQMIWAVVFYLIGWVLFKNKTIALVGLALFASHFVLDFFSGFPHHIYGHDTHQIGFGFYETHIYLAVVIEAIFVAGALWYYFNQETKSGVSRTGANKLLIIGTLVYAVVYLAFIGDISLRQWFGIPEFDLGFNTSVPVVAFTYIAMIWILMKAVPRED